MWYTCVKESKFPLIVCNQTVNLNHLLPFVVDDFSVDGGTPDFSFLLSGLSPPGTLPPSFVGCITQLLPSVPNDVSQSVLTNYCPQPQA